MLLTCLVARFGLWQPLFSEQEEGTLLTAGLTDSMGQGIIPNRLFGQGYLLWGRRLFIQTDAVPLALRFRELTLDHFIYQCRCNLDFDKTFPASTVYY